MTTKTKKRIVAACLVLALVGLVAPVGSQTGMVAVYDRIFLRGATASRLLATSSAQSTASVADLTAWVAGTANRITVANDGDGTITLSGPQDLHTAATPTFGSATLTNTLTLSAPGSADAAGIRLENSGSNYKMIRLDLTGTSGAGRRVEINGHRIRYINDGAAGGDTLDDFWVMACDNTLCVEPDDNVLGVSQYGKDANVPGAVVVGGGTLAASNSLHAGGYFVIQGKYYGYPYSGGGSAADDTTNGATANGATTVVVNSTANFAASGSAAIMAVGSPAGSVFSYTGLSAGTTFTGVTGVANGPAGSYPSGSYVVQNGSGDQDWNYTFQSVPSGWSGSAAGTTRPYGYLTMVSNSPAPATKTQELLRIWNNPEGNPNVAWITPPTDNVGALGGTPPDGVARRWFSMAAYQYFLGDANAYWGWDSGNPGLHFDAGDYFAYNRSLNLMHSIVGGAVRLNVGAGYVEALDSVLIVGTVGLSSSVGNVRFPAQASLYWRNAANSANLDMLKTDGSDQLLIGVGAADIVFGKALVALGGGAAPTFGTIGGSGPATAAQNSWMRWKDSGGNVFWVPVWK